jgi:type IV pilus assembly protein PilC
MANDTVKTFNYKARSAQGRFFEGKTKAASETAVSDFLVTKGLIPLEVKEQSGLNRDLSFGAKRVKPKEVAGFMRQFATMTGAAIPITRALETLRNQQSNPTFKLALGKIAQDIEVGSTFGDAIAKHPTIFTPLTISMIRAGESGGFLTSVLKQVSENLEAEVKLAAKIKSAMTYPVAILILAFVLVTVMLIFVVPVFATLFHGLGGALPVPTQILVNLSWFIKYLGWLVVVIVVVLRIVWQKNKHKVAVREFFDPIKLKIPIFGNLTKKLAAARFARNFGSLLDAGLPVMQVLDIVGATSGSIVIEHALDDVKRSVSMGELIAPQLRKHPIFPQMLVEMMAVGEDAGEIPEMMLNIATAYDEEVETMTDSLSSLLEPVMLMFLGTVVGGVVIALYLPIFDIYNRISPTPGSK